MDKEQFRSSQVHYIQYKHQRYQSTSREYAQ